MMRWLVAFLFAVIAHVHGFRPGMKMSRVASVLRAEEGASSKGFGKPKEVVEIVEEKDEGTKTYESMAKRGVPEYNIFLRPANGTETDWLPVGSMTIPRDTPVGKAIFEVEAELLKGAFKLYPKLKAFYDVRGENKEGMFEYGHCLKAFPDEPITLASKPDTSTQKNFFSNWLEKITNPIDTSELKSKDRTLKQ